MRKKWISLQPEELVRQHIIHLFIFEYGFSKNLISVEKEFIINQKRKRFDIVIYDKTSKPYILIECKAFTVDITQEVFDQIGVYNLVIQAPFLLATNGILSYCFCQNHHSGKFTFLSSLPEL
ncbi:MAG: type I restriction enzyme HsdR N-terminal domain-containing protein [Saprospiraceae bacterium]|nr:type I restriction enzyme HsdR N-terminal domain-containing protein [Saprospiraceae bacterium]